MALRARCAQRGPPETGKQHDDLLGSPDHGLAVACAVALPAGAGPVLGGAGVLGAATAAARQDRPGLPGGAVRPGGADRSARHQRQWPRGIGRGGAAGRRGAGHRICAAPGIYRRGVGRLNHRFADGAELRVVFRPRSPCADQRRDPLFRQPGAAAVHRRQRPFAGADAVVESFDRFPVDGNFLQALGQMRLHTLGSAIFSSALWIALPMIALLLFVNLTLGIISRVAPQMNIYAVGFPVTLTVGLLGITATLPMLESPVLALMQQAVELFVTQQR